MSCYLDTPAVEAMARRLHAGQVDKQGRDYFTHHVAVVAALAAEHGEQVHQAALLHDVVEDTDTSLADLHAAGVDPVVVAAVDSVTRRAGETYADLIGRSADDPVGVLVKLSDNATNLAAGLDWDHATARRLVNDRYLPARARLAASSGLSADAIAAQVDAARALHDAH